ncbi:(+)-neomenthol dehydrogenase-like [Hibiscus syriacus]|uniref:(+)-neomenthol dehydrogenase-like n=1 Tax=Hibiscus syriacus TaxID=106335 RepID=A0A6A3B0M6_HIBSY|nr:(+)-neomenthol dehydrogenase-like [Hibiscus syriacus]
MKGFNLGWLFLVAILVTSSSVASRRVRTGVFLSPKIELEPGLASNKFYFDVDFPRGHIAVKSFNAEVVDEAGNPVSLYDTYLHHWIVVSDGVLDQFFGLGSETRRTATRIPDPYGIEIGNPADIPAGFDETWAINVHAIDTRGVEDRIGCRECRCDLYNITRDESGRPLSPNYKGGLLCCYDGARCRRNEGFNGIRRTLYLRYTVTWVDMDSSIVPVKVYTFNITDMWRRSRNSKGINAEHDCRNGKPLCSSVPRYGTGEEAGNEVGYVVGMSTCYPKPGSVKISKGETLILESKYNSIQQHTGVMGLFYLLVAEKLA